MKWDWWIVTAISDGDTWSYGPFSTEAAAVELAVELEAKFPAIEYAVSYLMAPNEARESPLELANG